MSRAHTLPRLSMVDRCRRPTLARRWRPVLALACIAALSAVACSQSEEQTCSSGDVNLNGDYYNEAYDFEMVLAHDCASGAVVGTFYDDDDFAYALTGTVTGTDFDWEARRERPSGGSDLFYTPGSGMDIQSNGLSFRGRVLKNGAGPAGGLTFELE